MSYDRAPNRNGTHIRARASAIAPATIHSTQPNAIPIPSPTVAATTTRTPAGRTVRALHTAADAMAAPRMRDTRVHHTTTLTRGRAPRALVTCVVSTCAPVCAARRSSRPGRAARPLG